MSVNDCIFCRIINKEVPSYPVYEDGDSIAFLDINQSAPGHTCVILKKHGLSILDYTEQELGLLMTRVQTVSDKIKSVLKCDWITIGINHLEKKGVPHLHIHLIPRWDTDGGGALQSIVKNPPKEDLATIAEKLRTAA
jgi:histidine triad (HIT) family protein